MALTTVLGFPRIGPRRELKAALEAYWSGKTPIEPLEAAARAARADVAGRAARAGLGAIPAGDFALYDHVLDMTLALGAVPERFAGIAPGNPVDLGFAMARGGRFAGREVSALEMTKWFDTNYHYLVPELAPKTRFELAWTKHRELWQEARDAGHAARPVLLGPFTFLGLAKVADGGPLDCLDSLLEAYAALLADLAAHGVTDVQLDEPALVLDQPDSMKDALGRAYARLRAAAPSLRLWLVPYFGGLDAPTLDAVLRLPIDVLHLDLVRAPSSSRRCCRSALASPSVAGPRRRPQRLDHRPRRHRHGRARGPAIGAERLVVASSCSLLHVPYAAASETGLDPELRSWLAFCDEKLVEIALARRGARRRPQRRRGRPRRQSRSAPGAQAVAPVHDAAVRERMLAVTPDDDAAALAPTRSAGRSSASASALPTIPTTTIGSFPQTAEVRKARAEHRRGALDRAPPTRSSCARRRPR